MSLTAFILMGIYSCVYAYRRLTRPGMSAEIRLFFVRKHISYVATFIFIWSFYLASSYYQLFSSNGNDPSNDDNIIYSKLLDMDIGKWIN